MTSITHEFVSGIADGGDPTLVQPSDWNAEHVIEGGIPTAFIGARAYNAGTQSVNNTTTTTLTFDSESFDTDSIHSTSSNTDRLTVPAGMGGKWMVIGTVGFPTDADGERFAYITKNGTGTTLQSTSTDAAPTDATRIQVTWVGELAAGDYVLLRCYHNAGGALSIEGGENSTSFAMFKLDSGKLGAGIGASVRFSSAQTVTTNPQDITWDTEDTDTDGFHDTGSNTNRLTVPAGLGGLYIVSYATEYNAGGATARFQLWKNNTSLLCNTSTALFIATDTVQLPLAAGDYVHLKISGVTTSQVSNTDITSRFSIFRVDSGTHAPHGAWTSHTPTWSTTGTSPSLGNGTLTARYKKLDDQTYLYNIDFQAGSTTTFGTGTWSFSLPWTVASGFDQVLAGWILDSGTDNKVAIGNITGGSSSIGQITPEGGNVVSNTVPMTWATSDRLVLQGYIQIP